MYDYQYDIDWMIFDDSSRRTVWFDWYSFVEVFWSYNGAVDQWKNVTIKNYKTSIDKKYRKKEIKKKKKRKALFYVVFLVTEQASAWDHYAASSYVSEEAQQSNDWDTVVDVVSWKNKEINESLSKHENINTKILQN